MAAADALAMLWLNSTASASASSCSLGCSALACAAAAMAPHAGPEVRRRGGAQGWGEGGGASTARVTTLRAAGGARRASSARSRCRPAAVVGPAGRRVRWCPGGAGPPRPERPTLGAPAAPGPLRRRLRGWPPRPRSWGGSRRGGGAGLRRSPGCAPGPSTPGPPGSGRAHLRRRGDGPDLWGAPGEAPGARRRSREAGPRCGGLCGLNAPAGEGGGAHAIAGCAGAAAGAAGPALGGSRRLCAHEPRQPMPAPASPRRAAPTAQRARSSQAKSRGGRRRGAGQSPAAAATGAAGPPLLPPRALCACSPRTAAVGHSRPLHAPHTPAWPYLHRAAAQRCRRRPGACTAGAAHRRQRRAATGRMGRAGRNAEAWGEARRQGKARRARREKTGHECVGEVAAGSTGFRQGSSAWGG